MKLISCMNLFLFACLALSVNAANHNCDSCAECSAKIQGASYGDNVLLTKDAYSNSSVCIVFSGRAGVSFDCQGRTIVNNRTRPGTRALQIYSGGENRVRDCSLINFEQGIVSNRSNGNVFEGNIIDSASLYAISLFSSNNSVVRNNTLNRSLIGAYLKEAYNNTLKDNVIRELSANAVGINVSASRQNSFIGNDISAGAAGINMDSGSENNSLYSNRVCMQVYSTGIVLQNGLNYGDNNTCDGTFRYNDACVTGCKNTCSTATTTTTTTTQPECALSGDYPPCGAISLEEVVGHINKWAEGRADLASVVDIITGWSAQA
jgi:parallel beta-helix repeat protein